MAKIHMTANGKTPVCNRPGKTELTAAFSNVTCDKCPHEPTIDLVIALAAWDSPEARLVIATADKTKLLARSEDTIRVRAAALEEARALDKRLRDVFESVSTVAT